MAQPNFFSDLSLDPLFLSGLAVLSAQALYYAGHWLIGGRSQKERAMEGFEHVIISGVLFGLALILVNLSLWGLFIYLDLAGVKPPPGGALMAFNQTKGLWNFGANVQRALQLVEQTYRSYVRAAWDILTGYMAAVIGTGVLPWTSPVSMAIMNALAYIVTAATNILISAAVYAVAAAMAYSWPALLPLGAVLVTYERTRNLGAWLLALSVVAPIVLTAGADVLRSAVPPSKLPGIHTATPSGAVQLIQAMVLLGLIGLVLSVLTYAVSRLFDHAGASLTLE